MKRSTKLLKELAVFSFTAFISCLALLWLAGCSNPHKSDQQIKQQAAQTTEQVRANAKQAAAQAKLAAANAERKVNDIAAGIKEGMHSNASSGNSGPVDINRASEARLTTLSGITAARARRIIRNRPYHAPHDLVSKGVLTRAEYDQISGQIVAGND
jgi:DNA uptake protein ComE-like DNA-binding protein